MPAQWTALAGATFAYRVASQVALGADVWRANLDPEADPGPDPDPDPDRGPPDGVWGGGFHLVLTPLADRPWLADPVLDFGLETVRLDDAEDRSTSFVFGAGLRRRWRSRWSAQAVVRNRFLSIEEEPVEGVATGRDANLWEVALELTFAPAGHAR